VRKILLAAAFASAAIAGATVPAAAGCYSCYQPAPQYRQVVSPPQYRVVHRTVMVAPPRVVRHVIPAQYGVVHQTVMVAPARVAYRQTCGACGPEWRASVVPAQYGTVARTVMVAPPRVVAETIPAQYGTVAHTQMVAPAQAYWVQVRGCNSCGY
jgi:hypothetical protein